MSLDAKKWQSIYAYQDKELELILGDKEFLESSSKLEHFSRIGQWVALLKPGAKVLELGCGPGRYVAILAKLGCDVVGVDPVRYDTWNVIREKTSVEFVDNVMAERLPFPDEKFEGVACLGALLYFDDPDQSLMEIRRVLRSHGSLLLRTVGSGNLYERVRGRKIDPSSKNTYTMVELVSLLERNGFRVTDKFSYGFFSPIFPMYWWYLANGKVSLGIQKRLSTFLPPSWRVNHTVFATRTD